MRLLQIFAFLVLTFTFFSWQVPDAQADCGAIAYSKSGRLGWSFDYPSCKAASRAAKRRCGRGCGHFSFNGCGAIAMNGRGGYGWGRAGSKQAAINRAMRECRARNRGCSLRRWVCT